MARIMVAFHLYWTVSEVQTVPLGSHSVDYDAFILMRSFGSDGSDRAYVAFYSCDLCGVSYTKMNDKTERLSCKSPPPPPTPPITHVQVAVWFDNKE